MKTINGIAIRFTTKRKYEYEYSGNSNSSSFAVTIKNHHFTQSRIDREYNELIEFFSKCPDKSDMIQYYTNLYNSGYFVFLFSVDNSDIDAMEDLLKTCDIEYEII